MLSSRSPVSLSSSGATLLLFLFVSLPLPLPLLATPTPDQYDAATAHHHGYQPNARSIKLQSSETSHPMQKAHDGQLHSIKLQHSGYGPSETLLPIQTPHENDKLSFDHNKKDARNIRSADASEIHRVKLTKTDYQTVSLLPIQVSQLTRNTDEKKNDVPLSDLQSSSVDVKTQLNTPKDTIHYEGDDDITIDDVKSLDESLKEIENSEFEIDELKGEDNNLPFTNSKNNRIKRETDEETVRQKRDFIRWYGTSSFQVRPQHTYISSYQLSTRVPYFIPIWGNPSRIPVFFPLKPILFNPGYPVANPPVPQPTQQPNIPTVEANTENPPIGNVSVGNRINIGGEEVAVWGVVESSPNVVIPSNNGGGIGNNPNTQNRKPPTPPLLHRPSRTDEDDAIESNPPPVTQVPNELNPTRPSRPFNQNPTTRPPQIPNNNRDPLFDFSITQPPIYRPTTTTVSPQIGFSPGNNQITNQGRREPSRCVWAVISCCSPLSTNIRYSCFEQLGCDGFFLDGNDGNPCTREITTAALNAAQRFYEQTGARR